MIVSQERILDGAIAALELLTRRQDLPKDVVSDMQVIAVLLRHTRHLEGGGEDAMRRHCALTIQLLENLREAGLVSRADGAAGDVSAQLEALIAAAREVQGSASRAAKLKGEFLSFLRQLDRQLGLMGRQPTGEWGALMARQSQAWLTWQTDFDALGQAQPAEAAQDSGCTGVTEASLSRYIGEKLGDASARISHLSVLAGGFGKETSLFGVEAERFTGELVMRRDLPVPNLVGLDCHDIKLEFPLLQALHARGFPVPEPLWLETDSRLLPGPAFIVVRRVAGNVEGDALGGSQQMQAHLRRELAHITARIHDLPPLAEIGDSIPALKTSLWQKSTGECVRTYIESWYDYYLDTPHIPMPAVHHLFNWLLANVPETDEAPALVHGDIGFHNLLIDNGRLSGVLDWEYAHIGDPAEDIGYIKNGVFKQIDWPAFLREYASLGRTVPDEKRILFHQIWANVRNTVSIACVMDHFESGRLPHIRYGILPYHAAPHFIAQAESLIRQW